MVETVFEQITKSPEVLAKFLKPYIDETILYDMYCEKICTKSEECAKRGCIIDDTDTEYMTRDTQGAVEISLTTCTDDSKARLIILAKADA